MEALVAAQPEMRERLFMDMDIALSDACPYARLHSYCRTLKLDMSLA